MAQLPAQASSSIQSALNGSKQLTEVIVAIESGSDALVEGLILFKSKGLDKISDVLNNTVKKDVKTTKKLMDLANDYKTLTGSKEGVDASTKFIMIIDSKSKK